MIIDRKLVSAAALVTTIVITAAAIVYAYNSSSDMDRYLTNMLPDENGLYHGYMIILRYRSNIDAYVLDSHDVFDSSFYLQDNNIVFTDLRLSVAISKINFTFKNLLVVEKDDEDDNYLFLFSTDTFIINIIKLNIFTSKSFAWSEGLLKNGTNEVEIVNGRPLTNELVKKIEKTYVKGITLGFRNTIDDNNGCMISFKIDNSPKSVVNYITFLFYDDKSQLIVFENHQDVAKIPYDKIDCTYKNILLIRTDADTIRCIVKESEAERFLSNIDSGNYFDGFEKLEEAHPVAA